MPIEIIGPNWQSVRALRVELAEVPENGSLRWATGHGNKLEQLKAMAMNGVETVPFTEDFKHRWYDEGEIWLGRKFHHKEGKDILWPDKKFWRVRDYWTKFVPSIEEWRIHVFDGRVIARSKKIQEAEPEGAHPAEVRSHRNGWRFKHGPEPPNGIRRFAKAMVKACGYLYGACDILVKPDGEFCALEVNTAPAMDNYTRRAYVKAIRRQFAAK